MRKKIRAYVTLHDGLVHPECATPIERTWSNARVNVVEYYRCSRCGMKFEDFDAGRELLESIEI